MFLKQNVENYPFGTWQWYDETHLKRG